MKYILFISGTEGFITLKQLGALSVVKSAVLPYGVENKEIVHYLEINNIPFTYRKQKLPIELGGEPFVLLSSAFPYRILQEEIRAAESAVNIHAAKLPEYRGRHGNVWALINGEDVLEVTAHRITEKFDAGEVLISKKIEINDDMRLSTIQELIFNGLQEILIHLVDGDFKQFTESSDNSHNIYWRMRSAEDSKICWNQAAKSIFYFVRALDRPGIRANSSYQGEEYTFKHVLPSTIENDYLPGTVFSKAHDLYIATANSTCVKVIEYEYSKEELQPGMVLH